MEIKEGYRQLATKVQKGRHMASANVEEMDEHECLNCHTTFRGDFCPRCGQSAKTKRLTIHDGLENVTAGILKFNRGMSHSIFDLIYRPGYMAYDYVKGYRKEYYPPITMLLILVAISLFLSTLMPKGSSDLILLFVQSLQDLFKGHEWLQKPLDIIDEILLTASTRTLVVAIISVPLIWLSFHWTKVGRMTNWAETFYLSIFIACNKLIYELLLFPFEFATYKLAGNTIIGLLFGTATRFSTTTSASGKILTEMHSDGELVDFLAFFLMIGIMHSFYKISWLNSTLRVILYYVLVAILTIFPLLIGMVCDGVTFNVNY